jgi:hypothetical protein
VLEQQDDDYQEQEQQQDDSDVDSLCNSVTDTSYSRAAITNTSAAPVRLSSSAGNNIEWKVVERKLHPKFLPKPVANLIANKKKQRQTVLLNSSNTIGGSGSGRSLGSHHHSCSAGGGLARLVCRNQKQATMTAGITKDETSNNSNGHGNEFEDGMYNNSTDGSPTHTHTGSAVLSPRSMLIQHRHTSTRFCSFGVSANEAERLVQMGELETFDDMSSEDQADIADEGNDNDQQASASMEELPREESHRSQETASSQGEWSPSSPTFSEEEDLDAPQKTDRRRAFADFNETSMGSIGFKSEASAGSVPLSSTAEHRGSNLDSEFNNGRSPSINVMVESTAAERNRSKQEQLQKSILYQHLVASQLQEEHAKVELGELKTSLSTLFGEYNELLTDTQHLIEENDVLVSQLDTMTSINKDLKTKNKDLQVDLEQTEYELERHQRSSSRSLVSSLVSQDGSAINNPYDGGSPSDQESAVSEEYFASEAKEDYDSWKASEYAIAMEGLQVEMKRKTKAWNAERSDMEDQFKHYQEELDRVQELARNAVRETKNAEERVKILEEENQQATKKKTAAASSSNACINCGTATDVDISKSAGSRRQRLSIAVGFIGDKFGGGSAGSSSDLAFGNGSNKSASNVLGRTWHGGASGSSRSHSSSQFDFKSIFKEQESKASQENPFVNCLEASAAEALTALKLQALAGEGAAPEAPLPIRRSSSNRTSLLGDRSSSCKSVVSFASDTVGNASCDGASSVCSDPVFASACVTSKRGNRSSLLGSIQRPVLPTLFSSRYLENDTSNRSLGLSRSSTRSIQKDQHQGVATAAGTPVDLGEDSSAIADSVVINATSGKSSASGGKKRGGPSLSDFKNLLGGSNRKNRDHARVHSKSMDGGAGASLLGRTWHGNGSAATGSSSSWKNKSLGRSSHGSSSTGASGKVTSKHQREAMDLANLLKLQDEQASLGGVCSLPNANRNVWSAQGA